MFTSDSPKLSDKCRTLPDKDTSLDKFQILKTRFEEVFIAKTARSIISKTDFALVHFESNRQMSSCRSWRSAFRRKSDFYVHFAPLMFLALKTIISRFRFLFKKQNTRAPAIRFDPDQLRGTFSFNEDDFFWLLRENEVLSIYFPIY